TARKQRFVDIFHPFQQLDASSGITTEGVHLNEKGYYHLSRIIAEALGLPSANTPIDIRIDEQQVNTDLSISNTQLSKDALLFTVEATGLPFIAPQSVNDGEASGKIKV